MQIAEMLGVSLRTVRRRMSAYNLSTRMYFTVISDEQLDEIVREIQHSFPTYSDAGPSSLSWYSYTTVEDTGVAKTG